MAFLKKYISVLYLQHGEHKPQLRLHELASAFLGGERIDVSRPRCLKKVCRQPPNGLHAEARTKKVITFDIFMLNKMNVVHDQYQ